MIISIRQKKKLVRAIKLYHEKHKTRSKYTLLDLLK